MQRDRINGIRIFFRSNITCNVVHVRSVVRVGVLEIITSGVCGEVRPSSSERVSLSTASLGVIMMRRRHHSGHHTEGIDHFQIVLLLFL